MNEISNIHAFEDEDFLHACFVWGMAVLAVFAVCLVPVFLTVPKKSGDFRKMQNAVYLLGRSQRQDWALL